MGLAWARTALGREEAERYGRSVDERWPSILSIIEREDSLRTTSAGRLFDGVAALLGIRPTVTYEAQAAIELEAAAAGEPLDPPAAGGWEAVVTRGAEGCAVLDPSPLVARVVAARDSGMTVPAVAAAFHAGLGKEVASLARDLAEAAGVGTVALSGGVFQNSRLTEIVERELTTSGVEVLVHSRVPPNDGGVSIGQAAVAARRQC
jgi:hydrogenase maturation protein HypF